MTTPAIELTRFSMSLYAFGRALGSSPHASPAGPAR